MNAVNIMTILAVRGMTAAEMRTEARLYRGLAAQLTEPEASAYRQTADAIDVHAEQAEQAEADAIDTYLEGISDRQLRDALERRRQPDREPPFTGDLPLAGNPYPMAGQRR